MKEATDTTTESKEATSAKPHSQSRSSSFFWPLFLITLGILLLLNNLEILPWSIWNTLWRFWPLLLILTGLEMLLGKGRLTNLIVTLVGLTLLIFILATNIPQLTIWVSQSFSQLNITQIKLL